MNIVTLSKGHFVQGCSWLDQGQKQKKIRLQCLVKGETVKVEKLYLTNYSLSPQQSRGMKGIIVLLKSNQLVKNIETKQLQLEKRDSAVIVLVFKAGAFRYQPSSNSTNKNAAMIIDHQLDFTNTNSLSIDKFYFHFI